MAEWNLGPSIHRPRIFGVNYYFPEGRIRMSFLKLYALICGIGSTWCFEDEPGVDIGHVNFHLTSGHVEGAGCSALRDVGNKTLYISE
jgi:hypothetical protein